MIREGLYLTEEKNMKKQKSGGGYCGRCGGGAALRLQSHADGADGNADAGKYGHGAYGNAGADGDGGTGENARG